MNSTRHARSGHGTRWKRLTEPTMRATRRTTGEERDCVMTSRRALATPHSQEESAPETRLRRTSVRSVCYTGMAATAAKKDSSEKMSQLKAEAKARDRVRKDQPAAEARLRRLTPHKSVQHSVMCERRVTSKCCGAECTNLWLSGKTVQSSTFTRVGSLLALLSVQDNLTASTF